MTRSKLFLSLIEVLLAMAAGVAALLGAAGPARAALSDCIDATCRITTDDGSRGSGCVFEITQGSVYVLTAAHVVGNNQTVQCEFWHDGHQSSPLSGRVVGRSEAVDAAIVAVPEESSWRHPAGSDSIGRPRRAKSGRVIRWSRSAVPMARGPPVGKGTPWDARTGGCTSCPPRPTAAAARPSSTPRENISWPCCKPARATTPRASPCPCRPSIECSTLPVVRQIRLPRRRLRSAAPMDVVPMGVVPTGTALCSNLGRTTSCPTAPATTRQIRSRSSVLAAAIRGRACRRWTFRGWTKNWAASPLCWKT